MKRTNVRFPASLTAWSLGKALAPVAVVTATGLSGLAPLLIVLAAVLLVFAMEALDARGRFDKSLAGQVRDALASHVTKFLLARSPEEESALAAKLVTVVRVFGQHHSDAAGAEPNAIVARLLAQKLVAEFERMDDDA